MITIGANKITARYTFIGFKLALYILGDIVFIAKTICTKLVSSLSWLMSFLIYPEKGTSISFLPDRVYSLSHVKNGGRREDELMLQQFPIKLQFD